MYVQYVTPCRAQHTWYASIVSIPGTGSVVLQYSSASASASSVVLPVQYLPGTSMYLVLVPGHVTREPTDKDARSSFF